MEIMKSFGFEAAHYLPHVPEGHKCRRLHGHSYRVEVWVEGEVDEKTGWVIDFADISREAENVLELLDHRLLNEVDRLDNPTCENVARWIWDALSGWLPGLTDLMVWETARSGCRYRGPAV